MPNEDIQSNDNEVNVNRPSKGLFTESNAADQPEGTYRFALNAVKGTEDGNGNFLSNENSNIQIPVGLPFDYILGDCYLGNNTTLIFSISQGVSELDIFKKDNTFDTIVVEAGLAFNKQHQIKSELRVVNNQRVVYWVDGLNNPRAVNIDALYEHYTVDYQNWLNNGSVGIAPAQWNVSSFNLIKSYSTIPEFTSAKVLNYGTILPGSYSFAVRYIDSDLNATDWITTSNPINIYNSNLDNSFDNINGSRNSNNDAQSYQRAAKSIQLEFGNLDTDYVFYQVAIIQSVSNTGTILNVLVSQVIDINLTTYIYTGNDSELTTIDIAEIKINKLDIKRPSSIEQIENRLLLGNGADNDFPWCEFQAYASLVKTDLALYQNSMLNIEQDTSNGKNPTSSFVLKGYMPGEVYCFGIVYVMSDLTTSPVYHIPGPVSGDATTLMKTYESIEGYSNIHNCTNTSYWGIDYQGNPLLGQKVRFSRFPFRSEITLIDSILATPLTGTSSLLNDTGKVNVALIGTYPIVNGQPQVITFNVRYKLIGIPSTFTKRLTLTQSLIGTDIVYLDSSDVLIDTDFTPVTELLDPLIFTPTLTVVSGSIPITDPVITNIFGIKFENIAQPPDTIGFYIVRTDRTESDKLVIDNGLVGINTEYNGYHAFSKFYPQLFPTVADAPAGWITDGYTQVQDVDTDTAYLYYPEHQFRNNKRPPVSLRIEGEYVPISMTYAYSPENMKDDFWVVSGAGSYDAAMITFNKFGMYQEKTQAGSVYQTPPTNSIDVLVAYKIANFQFSNGSAVPILGTLGEEFDIEDTVYINAADYLYRNSTTLYNACCDNKICIVTPDDNTKIDEILNYGSSRDSINNYSTVLNLGLAAHPSPNWYNIKYVALLSNIQNAYSDFLTRTYYKEHNNMVRFDDVYASTSQSVDLFNGDTNIAVYNPVATDYLTYHQATLTDDSTWKIVAGVVLIIAAIVVTIVTYGATTPLVVGTITALAVGYGITLLQSGLTMQKLRNMQIKDYPNGLLDCVTDVETFKVTNGWGAIPMSGGFCYPQPATLNTYKWFSDIMAGLYIESSVNAPLRTRITAAGTDYLEMPQGQGTDYPFSTIEAYLREKMTTVDIGTGSGRLYRGYPMSEYYDINLDYLRQNREKNFYCLPINYDCCSTTQNEFPNRIWYSQQSFQEETVDNYRIFLPNNYRDIESEHGEITNIFRKGDEIYVHCKEALWYLPKNLQERVTGDIISFIGTGDFFSVPPKLIVDDDLGTAGSQDKWATVKIKQGVFFASQLENKVYILGDGLKVISDIGNQTWFKNNLVSYFNELFFEEFGYDFPNLANPANNTGLGLLATYDNFYNRILLTKKDFVPRSPYFFDATGAITNGIWYSLETDTFYLNDGVANVPIQLKNPVYFENKSFTMSFDIEDNVWIGWHSYLPHNFMRKQNNFFSFFLDKGLYQHNQIGNYQTFYETYYPFIVEYISIINPLSVRTVDNILLNTQGRTYSANENQYKAARVTFNKMICYNDLESTGLTTLNPQLGTGTRYMENRLTNVAGSVEISLREKYWHINDIRNYVINLGVPLFTSSWSDILSLYYIDKVPNPAATSFTKNWYELDSFKDRYMAIRLYLYDVQRANVNLTFQYSIDKEVTSIR